MDFRRGEAVFACSGAGNETLPSFGKLAKFWQDLVCQGQFDLYRGSCAGDTCWAYSKWISDAGKQFLRVLARGTRPCQVLASLPSFGKIWFAKASSICIEGVVLAIHAGPIVNGFQTRGSSFCVFWRGERDLAKFWQACQVLARFGLPRPVRSVSRELCWRYMLG